MKLNFEKINGSLAVALSLNYPEQWKEVMEQRLCDIDGTFLGFVDTYYFLAHIIPTSWTVVDFGCAYNPQAYYFRKHKKFIGVNLKQPNNPTKKFHFENTELFDGTIADYLKTNPLVEKAFAICNNVSSPDTELVRKYFPNCYIFYTA